MTTLKPVRSHRVYEALGVTDLASQGIRPGGLILTQRLLEFAGLPAGSRIVDIGCGTGVTSEFIRLNYKYQIVGIDWSTELLRHGRARRRVAQFVRGNGENLPFPDECANGIIAECSLSVMGYSDSSLNELGRVLMFGGKLMVTDVYAGNDISELLLESCPIDCCLKGAISKDQIFKKMELSGFEIDIWEDHSDMLKEFAIRMILSYGSMDEFWSQMSGGLPEVSQMRDIVSMVKPGYFLLIAHKSGSRSMANI